MDFMHVRIVMMQLKTKVKTYHKVLP